MEIQEYIDERQSRDENLILNRFKFLLNSIDLTTFLREYINFNKVFAPGVLSLSSKINTSDFFRENMESVISANILYAAIDEYYNEKLEIKTHCNLSNEFLNSVLFFYKKETEKINQNNFQLYENILNNYLYGIAFPSDEELFRSLGFHAAAENMGSIEFNSLNDIIKNNFKDLYYYLNSNDTYTWIEVHTYVEDIHCLSAINAIHLSLEFYSGPLSREGLNLLIKEGYEIFVSLQNDFFEKVIK